MADSDDVVLRELAGTMVLELHGNVDRSTTDLLTEAYERGSTRTDALRVVLDFTAADYINSSGIALVVSILARARSEGRGVAAIGLTEHYRHIFDITRLSDFIDVCADLETALESPVAGG
jgi:anti-sigma B factor antagonist